MYSELGNTWLENSTVIHSERSGSSVNQMARVLQSFPHDQTTRIWCALPVKICHSSELGQITPLKYS